MNLFSRNFSLALATAALLFVAPAPRSITAQTAAKPETPDLTGPSSQCDVCHNGKNPHTVSIPCDKVNQYLANHPGDYAGPCQGVTKEKPPKGSPTPKPHH